MSSSGILPERAEEAIHDVEHTHTVWPRGIWNPGELSDLVVKNTSALSTKWYKRSRGSSSNGDKTAANTVIVAWPHESGPGYSVQCHLFRQTDDPAILKAFVRKTVRGPQSSDKYTQSPSNWTVDGQLLAPLSPGGVAQTRLCEGLPSFDAACQCVAGEIRNRWSLPDAGNPCSIFLLSKIGPTSKGSRVGQAYVAVYHTKNGIEGVPPELRAVLPRYSKSSISAKSPYHTPTTGLHPRLIGELSEHDPANDT